MKTTLTIFLAFLLTGMVSAQDTLYVYKAGVVYSKCAVSEIDSVTFSKTYPLPTSWTVSDNDGHTYNYKTIGTQVWMTENLRTSKYRNGESITNLTANADWMAATFGAWCNYNNDSITYENRYGKLYNWYAVNDSRNIAPIGWHVATDSEWATLTNYVFANPGASNSWCKALASTTDWATFPTAGTIGSNLSINNYSGFSALPSGDRYYTGTFYDVAFIGLWWSSSESSTANAYYRILYHGNTNVDNNSTIKSNGYSVRCVRNF